MRFSLVTTLVFGLSLVGCDRFAPDAAVAFDPPSSYRAWWRKTEQCSGRQASFERIRWYAVPGDGFACPGGRCAGRWEDDHTIYLSEVWQDHEMVVRHEMLHDLIGHNGHPDSPYGVPCPLTWATWTGSGGACGDQRIPRCHDVSTEAMMGSRAGDPIRDADHGGGERQATSP